MREVDPFASVLLQPGDHPEVSQATLCALKRHSLDQLAARVDVRRVLPNWPPPPEMTAMVPEYNGRGGHPVLIPPEVVSLLLDDDCPDGLAKFWIDHPQLSNGYPWMTGRLRDIDTPGDLLS